MKNILILISLVFCVTLFTKCNPEKRAIIKEEIALQSKIDSLNNVISNLESIGYLIDSREISINQLNNLTGTSVSAGNVEVLNDKLNNLIEIRKTREILITTIKRLQKVAQEYELKYN
jgi:hypothetical protein